MSKTPTAEKPLAGLKVVEMSTMITCSLAAMMMRSQGAEVVKVEPVLMGDPMRYVGSMKNGQSALFHNCNRGKRSLAIDMKNENGIEAVKRLAAKADIMVNNYRPGVMDALGIGPDAVRALKPVECGTVVLGGSVAIEGHHAEDHVRARPNYAALETETTILCLSPSFGAGFAAVEVANNAVDFTNNQQRIEFVRITVRQLGPTSGPAAGHTPVTLHGAKFPQGAYACLFDGVERLADRGAFDLGATQSSHA